MSGQTGRESGFTFIELIVVIVLLGLLAAVALPRYLNVTQDAQTAALEGMAGSFGTALMVARAQWYTAGNQPGEAVTAADKVPVNLDGRIIYMNENGWPANTDPTAHAGEDTQTAEECQEVWNGILQGAPRSTVLASERANARYFVDVIEANPDRCRYEFILNSNPDAQRTHFFEYNLRDGTIAVFMPDRV